MCKDVVSYCISLMIVTDYSVLIGCLWLANKMFLGQVVNDKRLPLDLFVPNEETQRIMDEVDAGIGLHEVSSVEELFEELDR